MFLLIFLSFSILASLNLPAAIEDLSGAKVPQSVLEKSATVKGKGGLATIDQLMQNLPELLQRNREVLDEVRYIPSHDRYIIDNYTKDGEPGPV